MEDNPFQKAVIKIDGMMCDNCVRHVSEALESFNGIIAKKVKKGKVIASIHHDIRNDEVRQVIKNAGYEVVKIKR